MKRRDFIRLSALGGAGAFLLNGNTAKAFSTHYLLDSFDCDIVNDRCIVLIQLKGGNDGLNTVVPVNQYDTYAALRPIIKLNDIGQSNAMIQLDSTLPLDDQVALNPSLTGFKDLYESGKLNLVQGVSYPNHNKSHFKSTDNWMKGADGTAAGQGITTGWMSRFLNSRYNYSEFEDPLGIQLGSSKPSVGFHTEEEHRVDINLSGQDPSGYYTLISQIGTPAIPNTPSSTYGENLEFIMGMENNVNTYAERITEVFDDGSNLGTYPSNSFANQLKTVARLLKGGSKTKIFLVTLSGFDTHNSQIGSDGSHMGKHADLLTTLSEAVVAFQSDLGQMGLEDRVMTATFSEFGRKAAENGNYGTDHGKIAPLFVIGKHVKAGITGVNMDLDLVDNGGQLTGVQHDYRQLFTTMVQDWLGGEDSVLDDSYFGDFATDKLDIIDDSQVVPEECYQSANQVGIVENEEDVPQFDMYPNPAEDYTNLRIQKAKAGIHALTISSMDGKRIQSFNRYFPPGLVELNIPLRGIAKGTYILNLLNESGEVLMSQKLFKR
jgi:uncharacterized protein (DUF1501 family)